jgi:hypothetical protein
MPPAPPAGTGPLERKTGPLPARTGALWPLKPAQGARKATGPLTQTFGTAPLTQPAGAKRTTISLAPHSVVRPTTPPPTPPATSSASAEPALDLNALNEELDGVLKTLPERSVPTGDALADELSKVLAGLPAPEPAAPEPPVAEPAVQAAPITVASAALATLGKTDEPVDLDRDAAQDVQEPAANAAADAADAQLVLDRARVAKFTEQGDKLRQFGNSIEVIRTTLERSGASPDEVGAAMAGIIEAETARMRRFRNTVQWVAGVALTILLVLVAIALVISRPAPPPSPLGLAAFHLVNFTSISW